MLGIQITSRLCGYGIPICRVSTPPSTPRVIIVASYKVRCPVVADIF